MALMAEKSINYPKAQRLYSFSRRAAALGLSLASAGPGIAVAAPNLQEIDKLSGANLTVTDAQRQLLKASAVRVNLQDGNNSESCTGNKLNYGGVNYITTAAHCFRLITGSETGLLSSKDSNTAVNYINPNLVETSIVDPNYAASTKINGEQQMVYKTPQPMALVNGISIGLRSGDDALLSIGSSATVATEPAHSRSYDEVPALDYNPAIEPPAPGQEVALYGVPSPGFTGVSTTGRYLGRMQLGNASPFLPLEVVDAIAIEVKSDAQNPCYFGGSGQTALSADGHEFGGLTMADYIGYGSHNEVTNPDPTHSYPGDDRYVWLNSEKALGVDVPATKYNVLCYFAVRDAESLPDLIGGFSVFSAQVITADNYDTT